MTKVSVKIFGSEYTISGDRNADDIKEIAKRVNDQMRQICRIMTDSSTANLAILGALNIAEDAFDMEEEIRLLHAENARLLEENRQYGELWEKSKETVNESREEQQRLKDRILDDKKRLKDMQERMKEYENSFFDLQMENIKLKSMMKEKGQFTDDE